MAGSFDLIGFSYYCAFGVAGPGGPVPYPPDGRVGPMGYVPWAEGLGLTLRRLDEELPDRPLLVAEFGVGTDDDDWRRDTLRDGLAEVESAIADGVDAVTDVGGNAVDAAQDGVDAVQDLGGNAVDAAQDAVDPVQDLGDEAKDKIKDLF